MKMEIQHTKMCTTKAVLREVYNNKYVPQETKIISNKKPIFTTQENKKEPTKTKISRRKELTKIRAEISEIETIGNTNETKSWFFETTNKIDKHLAILTRKIEGSNK